MVKISFEKLVKWKKKVFVFLKFAVSFLIYTVSILFAFNVLIVFIRKRHPAWVWIGLVISVLVCNGINFFLSRKFPQRFHSWKSLFKDAYNVKRFLFFPPFSTGVSSLALTIFVFGFFNEPIDLIWRESVTKLDDIYELTGKYFVLTPLALILIMVGLGVCFFASVYFFEKIRLKFGKVLVVIFFTIVFALWFYFIYGFLFPLFGEKMSFWAKQIVTYLVSFSPVYWFYLLFIGSNYRFKSEFFI